VDPSTLRVIVPQSQLATVGNVRIAVTNPAGSSQPFVLTVTSPSGISVLSSGVVNAATFQTGSFAPGELITVFGSGFGPASLTNTTVDASGILSKVVGETRVLFDGVPAPLIYSTKGQLSTLIPYGAGAQSSISMQVEYQGQLSAPVALPIVPAVPGLFTATQSGVGQAAAFNQDGSLNSPSNPAEKGSILVLYGTGEGQSNPAGVDGRISTGFALTTPVLPVTVLINGVSAEIIYAGAAPGLVAGVMQLNVRIPDNTPTAAEVPIVVRVGAANSRIGVTVAVK